MVLCLVDHKKKSPMEAAQTKWLFTHEGYVKLVSMSPLGNKACSFGYEDQTLVVYDLHSLTIASKTKLDLVLSSYCFDHSANKTLMSFESSNELIAWDHSAPVHRRKTSVQGHGDFIYICRIADDGATGLSCDLSMHMLI